MDKPIDVGETTLLAADEPAALAVENGKGSSPIFLICEHASKRIPKKLGDMGLGAADLERHIAWDIGALAVARSLAARLDAPLAYQAYSRLVCDCNRQTSVADFIPLVSEETRIPGNHDVTDQERRQRIEAVYQPFHDGVGQALDRRREAGQPTVVISIHSFTPVFKSVSRPWHCGVLTMSDPSYAPRCLDLLRREAGLTVGLNEPYVMDLETDYTIPVHGEARGLPSVEIEMRQDLLADKADQAAWAARLAGVFSEALDAV